MQAFEFWKAITVDEVNLLEILITLLNEWDIQYCVIGGQAVNAYVEPLVSLDLDLAVAVHQIKQVEALLTESFQVKRFPYSLNITLSGSDLRAQIQTDPSYGDFVERATIRDVMGLDMPVASMDDVLQGKIWAAQDRGRSASKRQKDLADIARLVEAYPELRAKVPEDILLQLISD